METGLLLQIKQSQILKKGKNTHTETAIHTQPPISHTQRNARNRGENEGNAHIRVEIQCKMENGGESCSFLNISTQAFHSLGTFSEEKNECEHKKTP